MDEFLKLGIRDLIESYRSMRAVDLAMPTFVCLWLFILLMPLRGIDRRDPFGGLMYMLYLSGAGVALLFALPREYVASAPGLEMQFLAVLCMVMASAFRWNYGRDPDLNSSIAKREALAIQQGEEENGKPSGSQ